MFNLNESISGYQEQFYLYRGKAEDRPENISATSFPAKVLLNQDKYTGFGIRDIIPNTGTLYILVGILSLLNFILCQIIGLHHLNSYRFVWSTASI